jgi:hypothetical protein
MPISRQSVDATVAATLPIADVLPPRTALIFSFQHDTECLTKDKEQFEEQTIYQKWQHLMGQNGLL